jgi:hypothetical protein
MSRDPVSCAVLVVSVVLAAVLHLASGCAAPSSASAEQELATDIAIDAWELDLGFAPACAVDRANLGWLVLPSVDAVRKHCADPRVDACHLRSYGGRSTIVIHAERGTRYVADAYAHELAHWLQRCSGRAPSGDSEHVDRRVFPTFERSLAGQLRAELGL